MVKAPISFFSEILRAICIFFLKALPNTSEFPQGISCSPVLGLSLFFFHQAFSPASLESQGNHTLPHDFHQTCVQLPSMFAEGHSNFQHGTSVCLLDINMCGGQCVKSLRGNWICLPPHKTFYFLISMNSSIFSHTSEKMALVSLVGPVSPFKNLDFFFFSVIYANIVSWCKSFSSGNFSWILVLSPFFPSLSGTSIILLFKLVDWSSSFVIVSLSCFPFSLSCCYTF